MLTVLDTNVIYQALRTISGASNAIFRWVVEQKINMAISNNLFKEYEAVLHRQTTYEDIGMKKSDIDKLLAFIAYIGKPFDPRYLFRPNLSDESDNMVVELAVVSGAEYLITSNIRDFKNASLKFDCYGLVTPAEFYRKWRREYE